MIVKFTELYSSQPLYVNTSHIISVRRNCSGVTGTRINFYNDNEDVTADLDEVLRTIGWEK